MRDIKLRFMIAAFPATVLLTACGDDGEDTPPPTTEARVELVSWWTNQADSAAIQVLVDAYKASVTNGVVSNSATNWDTAQAIISERIASETNAPDIVHTLPKQIPGWLEYGTPPRNLLTPLDDALDPQALNTFASDIRASVSRDGKMYALPLNYQRILTLYFNNRVFQAQGLTPPTSYEDFKQKALLLKAAGAPFAVSAGNWGGTNLFMWVAAVRNGPTWTRDLMQGDVAFSAEIEAEIRSVLAEADDLMTNYGVIVGRGAGSQDADQAYQEMTENKISMFVYPDWLKAFFINQAWTPGTDFGIIPAPGTENLFTYTTDTISVPVGAAHHADALKFIRAASSVRTLRLLVDLKKGNSVRTDVDESGLDAPALDALRQLRTATVQNNSDTPAAGLFSDTLRPAMQAFIQDSGDKSLGERTEAVVASLRSAWPMIQALSR